LSATPKDGTSVYKRAASIYYGAKSDLHTVCMVLQPREVGSMSVDGVWSSDIGGAYGWEAIGTVFFENGRLLGGGRNHYSSGSYREKPDGHIRFHLDINQFGKKRALFGRKSEQLSIDIRARLDEKGKTILGEATMPERPEYSIAVRFRKRGELPE